MTNTITIMCSARCNKEKEEVESRIYRVFVFRLLKAFRLGACTVVSGSLFQSRIVLGKNEYWW